MEEKTQYESFQEVFVKGSLEDLRKLRTELSLQINSISNQLDRVNPREKPEGWKKNAVSARRMKLHQLGEVDRKIKLHESHYWQFYRAAEFLLEPDQFKSIESVAKCQK